MILEKETIKCEAVFNEDHTHRFVWKRIWGKDKPAAAVIMLNPSQSDNIITDTTTALVVNNIARLERFSGVTILNIYSLLTSKISFRWNSDEDLNDPENDNYIRKTAENCPCIIVAWGKSVETNKRAAKRAGEVLELLKPYKQNVFVLSDGERDNLHPLTPALRNQWILKPFDWAEYEEAKKTATESQETAPKDKDKPAEKEAS